MCVCLHHYAHVTVHPVLSAELHKHTWQAQLKDEGVADYAQGKNLKSYWEHRKSMKKNVEVHYHSETLARSVINHVNCSLLGTPGVDIV